MGGIKYLTHQEHAELLAEIERLRAHIQDLEEAGMSARSEAERLRAALSAISGPQDDEREFREGWIAGFLAGLKAAGADTSKPCGCPPDTVCCHDLMRRILEPR